MFKKSFSFFYNFLILLDWEIQFPDLLKNADLKVTDGGTDGKGEGVGVEIIALPTLLSLIVARNVNFTCTISSLQFVISSNRFWIRNPVSY